MPRPNGIDIYNMAEACKGVLSWDASQAFAILGEHSGEGMCLAASCYYMQFHKAGRSLRDFIGMYMEGRTFVPINMDAIALLQTEQEQFRDFNTPVFNAWLNHKSGLRRKGYGNGNLDIGGTSLRRSVFAMSDGYMLFGFDPPRGDGHAVAAYFKTSNGKTRVRFYDPNYGEWLFRDQVHFFDFFDYLLTMGYNNDKQCEYEFIHLD